VINVIIDPYAGAESGRMQHKNWTCYCTIYGGTEWIKASLLFWWSVQIKFDTELVPVYAEMREPFF
jgi:hypothetical protein